MTRDEVRALAEAQYGERAREDYCPPVSDEAAMFMLLVDVADAYVDQLEKGAADEVAPYLGVTPLNAAMNGLRENLVMIREGDLVQPGRWGDS